MPGVGYTIPISVSLANSSGNELSLGLNNYVDFGDGGLFAPQSAAPDFSQNTSASASSAAGGQASSAAAAGNGSPVIPSQVAGIDTKFLLIAAAGVALFFVLRK